MVALSVAFYARLSVGSRQIVEIFNILNEFMGYVLIRLSARIIDITNIGTTNVAQV